ncbi:MAG: glucosamine-6-phosphate deaminase [Verrucomicrobiota bacterium]
MKFDSETAWVDAVASLWRDRLRLKPDLRMCLPSGHTPNPIFAAMIKSVAAGQVTFRDAEVFALDEYGGLHPSDPGKCVNMLRHYLLDHVDLPSNRFHGIDVDAADVDEVCRQYDQLIGSGFDLTLLGLGVNGHLGINEPGSDPNSPTRRVDLDPITTQGTTRYLTHGHLPTWGATVGLKPLLGSKEVWLMANGPHKMEIVQRVLEGEISNQIPASLLRNHPNAWLIVDAKAGQAI